MEITKPILISISRQLGTGGAYLGQRIAQKLNIYYADREIINQAAQQYFLLKDDEEARDEEIFSFLDSFSHYSTFAPDVHIPSKLFASTEAQVFKIESDIIQKIVKANSAVIVGRFGFYFLRDYPNHISIFLHGDIPSRSVRVQKLYNVSEQDARLMIIKNDREKAVDCKAFTGKDWTDAKNYNISINTGKMDIDRVEEIIMKYIELIIDK
ncbi:MAG: cytidylate kinase-like family protein [bacterium]